MQSATYAKRRAQIEFYFDRTAADRWAKLTSDVPVSKIRATVRAGRDEMRATLLNWLPADLTGKRVLDAGCGTGALAVEAAKRGAHVVAIDLSPTLVDLARERVAGKTDPGSIDFQSGDMLSEALGRFDYVVGMDSLIHYNARDVIGVLAGLTARTNSSLLFTFAPRTPMLSVMHAVGRLFPSEGRSPAIEPLGEASLHRRIQSEPALAGWSVGRTRRIKSGFYFSQALELTRS